MENIFRSWTEFNKIQNNVFKGMKANAWLSQAQKSTELWKKRDYPTGEAWKYVSFKNLPTTHFRWPEQDLPTRQVADDQFVCFEIQNFKTPQKIEQSQLPEGLAVLSELEVVDSFDPGEEKADTDNLFAELSGSFRGLGVSFKISSAFKNDKPIKLILNFDKWQNKDLYLHQNINIQCKEGASADLFIEVRGQSFSGLSNICFNASLDKTSSLNVFFKERGGAQSHFLVNSRVNVAENSRFRSFDFTFPALWSRHTSTVNLMGEFAEGELYGAYFNDGNKFCDHHTSINHWVGKTESKEDYRGLLSDQAKAVFNGRVFIAEKAAKSNSVQLNKNLMLSSDAEIDTKPELQIYNDDVKAAHGATVGQLDEEQRFYLQSRGYSKEVAGKVLAKAFIYDLLDNEEQRVKSFFTAEIDAVLQSLEES